VLHHIAVGARLEQPAGKDAVPFIVAGFLHVGLNECAGFRRAFPRGGLFAGAQPDDDGAHAQRLPRFHGEIAGEPVALVEEADDGDALRHGRAGQ